MKLTKSCFDSVTGGFTKNFILPTYAQHIENLAQDELAACPTTRPRQSPGRRPQPVPSVLRLPPDLCYLACSMAGERTAKPMGEAVARCLARGRVFVNVVFFSAGILVGLYVSGLSHGHSTLETAG